MRSMIRRVARAVSMGVAVAFVLSAAGEGVEIVRNGVSDALIVTAPNASKQVRDAAALLARYIEKGTGAAIPVNRTEAGGRALTIYVGADAYARGLGLGLKGMDGDGFVIAVPDERTVVIAGPTDWGTQFGVYDFLERYAGVRWLMPGEWGEDVPARHNLAVPTGVFRSEPAYLTRQLSEPNGDEFARRNRHRAGVPLGHNLYSIFLPSRYVKTHPEFFAMLDGKRRLPKEGDHGWQPCFSAEGIVQEAVKTVKEYFRANPEATAYSLSINDNGDFCQCPKCLAKAPTNFLGVRNHSDLYFDWANRVVEAVLKDYPDKGFGALAYTSGLAEPPKTVKVHPRIVTYFTCGRIGWIEPELRAEGHRLTESWKPMCPSLGWYDYIYGTPFVLPRVFFHQMADSLRYGRDAGVRVFYAEIFYNWGEGPKEYLALRLLWDPSIDVDATLRDWYERAVGKAAAPDLAAYYALWEDFWTRRIRSSAYYSKKDGWMPLTDPGYLDIVTAPDMALSRRLLEAAAQKADTEARRKRAGYLLRAFEYYEASVFSLQDDLLACGSPPVTEREALGFLATVERAATMKEKRWRLVDEFAKHPVLALPLPPDRYLKVEGDRWGCYPLWSTYEWAKPPDSQAARQLARLEASPEPAVRSHASLMRAVLDRKAVTISRNPDFGTDLDGWRIRTRETSRVSWTGADGHDSPGALTANGPCRLEQFVPLEGKVTLATCLGFVKFTGAPGTVGEVVLDVEPEKLTELNDYQFDSLPTAGDYFNSAGGRCVKVVKLRPGAWVPLAATIKLATTKAEVKQHTLTVRLNLRKVPEGSTVTVDDLGVYPHQ